MAKDLLSRLESEIRWNTAFHTYGNSHITLIGLLVDWWINCEPEHEALEGSPSFALKVDGGGELSDGILIERGICKGVIEVEGTDYSKAIIRMEKYFNATGWEGLEFGIFFAYRSKATGGFIPLLPMDDFINEGIKLTQQKAEKQFIMLTLDKRWDEQISGPRARKNDTNGYYKGKPFRLTGAHIKGGTVIARRIFREI